MSGHKGDSKAKEPAHGNRNACSEHRPKEMWRTTRDVQVNTADGGLQCGGGGG